MNESFDDLSIGYVPADQLWALDILTRASLLTNTNDEQAHMEPAIGVTLTCRDNNGQDSVLNIILHPTLAGQLATHLVGCLKALIDGGGLSRASLGLDEENS